MKSKMFFMVIGLAFVLFSFSSAQVPQMINYQGKLTKASGAPLDTTIQMVFTIYADSGGVTSFWTETQAAVKVEKGVFNVLLGSVNPISYSVFDGNVRYLGVKVGDDPEITPRKKIVSVSYAFKSFEADTADYARAGAGGGGEGWVDDGSVVRLETGTDYVGIGTSSPNEQLEITGNLRLPTTTATEGIIKVGADRFLHSYGTYNTFIGKNAGNFTITGSGNTANGYAALNSNTSGYSNTANGYQALNSNTTGYSNTANGLSALHSNTTGSLNTANGVTALFSNTTGNYNTALGCGADVSSGNLTNATAIGALATVAISNALVLGGTGGNAVKVGIGTSSPAQALDVVGTAQMTGFKMTTSPANGYVLTSDASGVGTWQTAAGTIGGSGTANYIPKFTAATTIGNSVIYETSNKIGIGTTSPNEQLEMTGNLRLPVTTATTGIIYAGANRFIHNYGANNTFVGETAGNLTMTGIYNTVYGYGSLSANTTGSYNTACGPLALMSNTEGDSNTAAGLFALSYNTTGSCNTAVGLSALSFNTTGNYNTANGQMALRSNTTGNTNTADGVYALYSNTTGDSSTAVGYEALYSNTTGLGSTAIGFQALFSNTASYNVATGFQALYSNTTGYQNTANGFQALFSNTTGTSNTANGYRALSSNTTGNGNTSTGSNALFNNTIGYSNTAYGHEVLFSNSTGYDNTAIGKWALAYNTSGNTNTAAGHSALADNTTGYYNTAVGAAALTSNTTGYSSTATGIAALRSNTTGNYNTANGQYALYYNTTQSNNTGLGFSAGDYYTSSNSTFLGYEAYPNASGYDNSMCLGYNSRITASNQVRVGNASVTSIGGYVAWTDLKADGRYKKSISENVPGLAFISRLRPVSYTLDVDAIDAVLNPSHPLHEGQSQEDLMPSAEEITSRQAKSQIVYTGFIAQEVEQAAQELGYDFSGVDAPKSDKGMYGLRYAEFVVPLVKAVQEQQQLIQEQQQMIQNLQKQIDELKKK